MSEVDGIWRTVGGRRIFIKKGQNLSDAMKESGKFDNKQESENFDDKIKNIDKELEKIKLSDTELNKMYDKWYDYKPTFIEQNGYDPSGEDREKWFIENNKKYKKYLEKKEELFKEREKFCALKENKNKANNYKKALEISKKHNFYSEELKDMIEDLYSDNNSIAKTKGLIELDKILKDEKREISQSPYSFSIYAIKNGEEITWGSKPKESYRLSDHWNFNSQGETHCKLKDNDKYIKKIILAKYNGKEYEIIKEFENE